MMMMIGLMLASGSDHDGDEQRRDSGDVDGLLLHQLIVVLQRALDDVHGALLCRVVDRRPAELVRDAQLLFRHLLPHLHVDVPGRHDSYTS